MGKQKPLLEEGPIMQIMVKQNNTHKVKYLTTQTHLIKEEIKCSNIKQANNSTKTILSI
jgi:hypothetical protein